MVKIIKEELQFEESLKQRLKFICEFSKVNPIFINCNIRKMEKTNLSYIEPHRAIIRNITFNIKNVKIIFVKFFLLLIARVNEIEESLIVKGYSNE